MGSGVPIVPLTRKQELFTEYFARLILFAIEHGYGVVIGEVQRGWQQAEYNATHCARCRKTEPEHTGTHKFKPIGIRNSLHIIGLAGDLLLFKTTEDGKRVYLTDSRDYQVLGEWWKKLDPMCCWGGDFNDGGHFSIMHGGRK